MTAALADYAAKARDIGGDIGSALVCAFTSAENAVGEFVKTGKLDFRDLVTSMIADLGEAGGAALHPRPHRQRAVGRAGRRRWHLRQHPACGRHGRIAGPGPHGPGAGLCQCPAHACRRLGRDQARRGSGDPAAGRAGSVAPRGRGIWPRASPARPPSTSPSWPATPKASGNRARRSRPTSPARCPWAGGACDGVPRGRFPDNISRGARGGPERRTQIVELASGDEERNASWANSRRRYDVAYGIRRADDLAAVVAFFEARNGRLHGFRYKDWADYKSCLPSQAIAADRPADRHRQRQPQPPSSW